MSLGIQNSAIFLANTDSLSVQVNGATWVHIDGGTFNSGTIAMTYLDARGVSRTLRDSSGVAVAYAAGADDFWNFPGEAKITLAMQGAAGATSVYVEVRSEPRR